MKGESLEGLCLCGGIPQGIGKASTSAIVHSILVLKPYVHVGDALKDEAVFPPLLCPVFIRNNPVARAKEPGYCEPTKPLHSVFPAAEPCSMENKDILALP